MEIINSYQIDLRQANSKKINFTYQLQKEFFSSLEQEEIEDGNIFASIDIKEVAGEYFHINIDLEGTVIVPCDRCLDPLVLDINCNDLLILSTRENDFFTNPNIKIISPNTYYYNIAWDLYEIILTSLPIERIHQEGECDLDMINRFSFEKDK